jgi:GDPmannose 4,6-dehydratase
LQLDTELIKEDKRLFRPNEIKDIYGDNSFAKSKLGWNYNYPFFDILDMLVEEELKNLSF